MLEWRRKKVILTVNKRKVLYLGHVVNGKIWMTPSYDPKKAIRENSFGKKKEFVVEELRK